MKDRFLAISHSHRRDVYRWSILILACLIFVGEFASYDPTREFLYELYHSGCLPNDNTDNTSVDRRIFLGKYICSSNFSDIRGNVFAMTSCIGVLASFSAGIYIDKFGNTLLLRYSLVSLIIGQIIFGVGLLFRDTHYVIFTGIFVSLFSSEALFVGVLVLLSIFFVKKELAFSMGICLSVSRITRILVKDPSHFAGSLIVGLLVCLLSLLVIKILRLCESKSNFTTPQHTLESYVVIPDVEIQISDSANNSNVDTMGDNFEINSSSSSEPSSLGSSSSDLLSLSDDSPIFPHYAIEKTSEPLLTSILDLSILQNCDIYPWLILCGVLLYTTVVPFSSVSRDILLDLYFPSISRDQSNSTSSGITIDDEEFMSR